MTTQEIENGMKLLDEKANKLLKVEDWRQLINKDKLNMKYCGTCILGQLFNDYHDGLEQLGIELDDYEDEQVTESLGFRAKYGSDWKLNNWDELTNQWKQALSGEQQS